MPDAAAMEMALVLYCVSGIVNGKGQWFLSVCMFIGIDFIEKLKKQRC